MNSGTIHLIGGDSVDTEFVILCSRAGNRVKSKDKQGNSENVMHGW